MQKGMGGGAASNRCMSSPYLTWSLVFILVFFVFQFWSLTDERVLLNEKIGKLNEEAQKV